MIFLCLVVVFVVEGHYDDSFGNLETVPSVSSRVRVTNKVLMMRLDILRRWKIYNYFQLFTALWFGSLRSRDMDRY